MTDITEPTDHSIEFWKIADIKPYAMNVKHHSDEQVEKLAVAIRTYGWTAPLVVWTDGTIIAGHGRRLAALLLGLEKVPVICRSDLTEAEADALRLADNRVVSTEYDMAGMEQEMMRLSKDDDIDLSTLGFDEKELDFLNSDLGQISDEFLIDDLNEAVDAQREENEGTIDGMEDIAAPVSDALGFKHVTLAQSRQLRAIVGEIESRTESTGAAALISFLEQAVS